MSTALHENRHGSLIAFQGADGQPFEFTDASDIGQALGLSQKTVDAIHNYPLPELMAPSNRFSAFTYVANDKIRR